MGITLDGIGMKSIEAVDIADPKTVRSQNGRKLQKSVWLCQKS